MLRATCLLIVSGVIVGVVISSRFVLTAQIPGGAEQETSKPSPLAGSPEKSRNRQSFAQETEQRTAQLPPAGGASPATLQEALLRTYRFPFARPTPLSEVCNHLKRTLHAPVVIDLAALERQHVEPDDQVQLELEGVRLKTGLKLLFDQVGLTYRVEPEDNLLIITDQEGSQDPVERIWAELRALHRDLHDVQDSVSELRGLFGDEQQIGPQVRKPTIIEEMPEGLIDRREHAPEKPGNSGEKPPGKAQERPKGTSPPSGSREPAPRIPLSHSRRNS
jgi:hypothetical protein